MHAKDAKITIRIRRPGPSAAVCVRAESDAPARAGHPNILELGVAGAAVVDVDRVFWRNEERPVVAFWERIAAVAKRSVPVDGRRPLVDVLM